MRKKIVIGNWKMQLHYNDSIALALELRDLLAADRISDEVEIAVCPSYDALAVVAELLSGTDIGVGSQDVFWQETGAYTGEESASMLKNAGCSYVIIGHSERRRYLNETDAMVNAKVKAALAQELIPVLCVGETHEERVAGHTDIVILRQVIEGLKGVPVRESDQIIVAYEPVWVIGTGQAIEPPAAEYAARLTHRALLDLYRADVVERQCRILYGGSVDESNVAQYTALRVIDGLLVGNVSLQASRFVQLIRNM